MDRPSFGHVIPEGTWIPKASGQNSLVPHQKLTVSEGSGWEPFLVTQPTVRGCLSPTLGCVRGTKGRQSLSAL